MLKRKENSKDDETKIMSAVIARKNREIILVNSFIWRFILVKIADKAFTCSHSCLKSNFKPGCGFDKVLVKFYRKISQSSTGREIIKQTSKHEELKNFPVKASKLDLRTKTFFFWCFGPQAMNKIKIYLHTH